MTQRPTDPATPPAGPATVGEAPRLAADAKTLAAMLGISARHVRTLDASGKLPRPVKIGGCVRWFIDEIRAWLAAGTPDRAEWEALRAEGPGRPDRKNRGVRNSLDRVSGR